VTVTYLLEITWMLSLPYIAQQRHALRAFSPDSEWAGARIS
jgi:hypothetical protein